MAIKSAKDLVVAMKGQWHGNYGMVCCPAHNDRNPSLSVSQGQKGLLFKCFAGCEYKDIIAALETRNFNIEPEVHPDIPLRRPASYDGDFIKKIMSYTIPIANTPGARYLLARGLGNNHPVLRYNRYATFGKGDNRVTGAAVIAPMIYKDEVVGFQRVFLDPKGKEAFGRFKPVLCHDNRAAIRLSPAAETLAITEGFEDAIAYSALNGTPAWGLPGIEWLANTDFPQIVKHLIVAFDNDKESLRVYEKLLPRLQERFETVTLHLPKEGFKDWNEQLFRMMPPPK